MIDKKATIIKAVIMALLGIIFIIFSEQVAKYLIIFLGGLLITFGIINLVTSIKTNNKITRKLGIYIVVFGVIVILISDFILSVIGICIGLFCLFSGISTIGIALKLKEEKFPFIIPLIKGATSLIISVVLISLPKIYINVQIIILGIYLIINAANSLYNGMTRKENDFDFIKFYFHNEYNSELENKDEAIDVESSVIDQEDN